MLILLPPSQGKADVHRGKPVDLDALSFPALRATREAVLDAVMAVSGEPGSAPVLGIPPSQPELIGRNRTLRDNPTVTADRIYTGVLYHALDVAGLDTVALRRARSWVVVVSALWGAIRLGDRIPSYRLHMCARLPGLGHLPQTWQAPLAEVLPAAAGRRLIVDCRSSEYLTAWRPSGELASRTVLIRVVRQQDGSRKVASHSAKWTRGLVARHILQVGLDPRSPERLAEDLTTAFTVDLTGPLRPGRPWTLTVVEP